MALSLVVAASAAVTGSPGSGSTGARSASAADAATIIAVAGNKYYSAVQNIGTSEEAVGQGEITTMGYVYLKNLDQTNYITLRSVTGTAGSAFCRLNAGEFAMFRSGQTALYAIANTGACDLQILIIDP